MLAVTWHVGRLKWWTFVMDWLLEIYDAASRRAESTGARLANTLSRAEKKRRDRKG